ncbi:HNH endonuclease [Trinickia sp.]|uniref:HNH endonuclease n=1 Tax=Trinickia sp. TaxID=2571163 RepID=UPI003F7F66FD
MKGYLTEHVEISPQFTPSSARIKGTSANAAKNLLKEKGLTFHHLSTTEIQFIPSDLHGNVPHTGSAADMRKSRC